MFDLAPAPPNFNVEGKADNEHRSQFTRQAYEQNAITPYIFLEGEADNEHRSNCQPSL